MGKWHGKVLHGLWESCWSHGNGGKAGSRQETVEKLDYVITYSMGNSALNAENANNARKNEEIWENAAFWDLDD